MKTKIYKLNTDGPAEDHPYMTSLELPERLATWDVWDYWERERTMAIVEAMESESKDNLTMLEVGAEQGVTTALILTLLSAAKRAGLKLHMVEPSPEFWPLIKAIFKMNQLPMDPEAFHYAGFASNLGRDVNLSGQIFWSDIVEDTSVEAQAYRKLGDHKDVPTTTIDRICAVNYIKPDIINIDIEGAELLALMGAKMTIKTYKPTIFVSVHEDLMANFGHKPQMLINYMKGLGYSGELIATDHEAHYVFRSN